jgi:serine/threonine protein kinase
MNAPQWTPPISSTEAAPPDGASAAPRVDALLPGTHLEEFEVERVLASSGFGIVYLAVDPRTDRRVAVKEYFPLSLAARDADGLRVVLRSATHAEAFERGRRAFIEEALLLARCDHPSLVKVLGSWHDNGTVYRAMPHYPGNTLLKLRQGLDVPPDEPSLRALLDGVLGALEVLHAENVVHRGITPGNILLLPDDHPMLLDGGAARHAIVGENTRALMSLLEPSFAAPEQVLPAGERSIGAWTDLYALAAVMHYCVSGSMPRLAPEGRPRPHLPLATVVRGLRSRFPFLHYSRQFAAAIDAALASDPAERPRSVAEFRDLLGNEALTELPDDVPEAGEAHEAPNEAASAASAAGDVPEPVLGGASRTDADAGWAKVDPSLGHHGEDTEHVELPLWAGTARREPRHWGRWAVAAGLLVAAAAAAWTLLPPQGPGPEVLAERMPTAPARLSRTETAPPAIPSRAETAAPVGPGRVAGPAEPIPPANKPAAALPEATGPSIAAIGASTAPAKTDIDVTRELQQAPTSSIGTGRAVASVTAPAAPRTPQRAEHALRKPTARASSTAARKTPPEKRMAAVRSVTNPREICSGRTQFALYRCMKTQCAQPAWSQHPLCKRLRVRDEVD